MRGPLYEYRITRPELYSNPRCPGHKDLTARQGYYVTAETPEEAVRKFRDGDDGPERLDVELVKVIRNDGTREEVPRKRC